MPSVAQVWDFPFRLGPGGSVATVEQDSDRDIENLLAVACLTRPGERQQAPSFGIADPAFVGWELPSLERHVLDFGPNVAVSSVIVERTSDIRGDREVVSIAWERRQ
jgi:hypothetical protein